MAECVTHWLQSLVSTPPSDLGHSPQEKGIPCESNSDRFRKKRFPTVRYNRRYLLTVKSPIILELVLISLKPLVLTASHAASDKQSVSAVKAISRTSLGPLCFSDPDFTARISHGLQVCSCFEGELSAFFWHCKREGVVSCDPFVKGEREVVSV